MTVRITARLRMAVRSPVFRAVWQEQRQHRPILEVIRQVVLARTVTAWFTDRTVLQVHYCRGNSGKFQENSQGNVKTPLEFPDNWSML